MTLQTKKTKEASSEQMAPGSLRSKTWERFLQGPDPQLIEKLYVPALSESIRYDRCCAYFSSSVLAAAARGFGKLIERLIVMGDAAPKPAVRLVVNEELTAEDVRALTEAGDFTGLEKSLKRRFKNPKDFLTKRRLAMLGWLTKYRYLDIRVGVMRFGGGIVHGKFGIATDEAHDAVVFNGSGNESAQGLLANYEQLEVSTSWDDLSRCKYYSKEFEALWNNKHSAVHTVTLPEALRLKLIKFAPKEPPIDEPTNELERQRVAMLWKFIVEAPYLSNGMATCDATAMVDMWPHQRNVVEEVSEAWPNGRLLCDEVGLGKTIEAIFILRRLMAGRGVRRVLILLPKGLLAQWQGELREKGGMIFPRLDGTKTLIWPDGTKKRVSGLSEALKESLLLMSRETARTETNLAILLKAEPWDLVLLDEAHAARRRRQEEGEFNTATLLLDLLRKLQLNRQTRSIMLLSATPMQTHPWEPWDLLSVLGEGGAWLSEFSHVRNYYSAISKISNGRCDIETAERAATLIATDDQFPQLLGDKIKLDDPKVISQKLAFAPSSKRKEIVSWLRRGSPLMRRMHRNTRDTLRAYHQMGLLKQVPPRRDVNDFLFEFQNKVESDVYDSVTDYIEKRFEDLESEKPGKGFVMTVYRRRASSSPQALKRSLDRRRKGLLRVINQYAFDIALSAEDAPEAFDLEDLPEAEGTGKIPSSFPEDPQIAREELREVNHLLEELRSIGELDSKRDRFFDILRSVSDDGRPVLVFTGYVDTRDYLRESLISCYGKNLGCYSGDGGQIWDGREWKRVTKDSITKELQDGRLRVLICTDAASEGLNLQAAGAIINYDLPWNPSKVEQRIGRIDRIGQSYPVVKVVNLFLKDSVDERVYTTLRRRCGLFEHFVGTMQPVLARARRMLMGQEPLDPSMLESEARQVEQDILTNEIYIESIAAEIKSESISINLNDIKEAILSLPTKLGFKVNNSKETGVIRISGVTKKKISFAPTIEVLEKNYMAYPISPFDSTLAALSATLARPGERLPLVIESFKKGAFRASCAYWVGSKKLESIDSFSVLKKRIAKWDGYYPDVEEWQQAVNSALQDAKKRVRFMQEGATNQEKKALDSQLNAARLRLLRELGKYLVCLGASTDALNESLFRQMSRDIASAKRLQKCIDKLGGYPEWRVDLRRDLERFAESLTEGQRQARLLGSGLDAALDDPRWTTCFTPTATG